MAATTQTSPAQIIDKEQGLVRKQTKGIELKTVATDRGIKETVTGYLATTHIDQGQDQYTKTALENMAQQINNDSQATIDTVYPDLKESQIGNIGHNNNPAAEEQLGFGRTEVVPAFKITQATVIELEGGEHYALQVKGELLSDSQPDDVEAAIKNAIKTGVLHSFSIEYIPTKVEYVMVDDEPVRRIHEAEAKGAALTGRPMNRNASMTDQDLKTMAENRDDIEIKNMEEAPSHEDEKDGGQDLNEEDNEENNVTSEQGGTKDITGKTMTEEDVNDEPEENEPEEVEQDDDEQVAEELKTSVEELKSDFKSLKEQNETLKSENEELKNKLEDLDAVESVKSNVSEIKEMIEDSDFTLEDEESTPQVEQEQKREKEEETKAAWKRELDMASNPSEYLKKESRTGKTNMDMIKSEYGVDEKEVKQYVRA